MTSRDSLLNRILERNALRIILRDPSVSRFTSGEDLKMIDVARERVGVDVDPTVFIGSPCIS